MAGAANGRARWQGLGGWLLRVAVSALLLWFVLRREDTRVALAGLHGQYLTVLIGVLSYAACQMLNAWKWGLVLRAMGHDIPFWELVKAYFAGMFSNFFLPTSIGGDVVRAGLMVRYQVSLSEAALSVFIQRFAGLLAVLLLGVIGSVLAGAQSDAVSRQVLLGVAWVSVVALAMAAVGALVELRWQVSERLPKPIGRPLGKLGRGLIRLAQHPGLMAAVLGLSLLFQLLMVSLNQYLGLATAVRPDYVHWFWLVPVVTLGAMLPVGLGGVGPREVVAQRFLDPLGYGPQAVAWSLLWQAIVILTSLPGGLVLLSRKRTQRAEAEAAARQEAGGQG